MNRKALEEAGLTTNEAKIYLSLLEKGSSKAGTITRNTGIHRRTVYDAIERLIQKGLVSYIKTNNYKYYEAADPERILSLLKEKENLVKDALPQLKLLKEFSQEKKETQFFRGKQALKTVFNDQIIVGKEVLVFGDSVQATTMLKYFFPHFEKQRIKKRMNLRILFGEQSRKTKISNIPNSEIRYIKKSSNAPVSTNIYGNKVSIVIWEENPKAILIEEPALAQSFKGYFEFMWNKAKN